MTAAIAAAARGDPPTRAFVAGHSLWRRGLGAALLTGFTTLFLATGVAVGGDPEP